MASATCFIGIGSPDIDSQSVSSSERPTATESKFRRGGRTKREECDGRTRRGRRPHSASVRQTIIAGLMIINDSRSEEIEA